MAREVDPRRTRKAQRLIEKLQRAKEGGPDCTPAPYSGWEDDFLSEVGERLDKYGSAFRDLSKGAPDAALSVLQTQKLKEIAAKAAGKGKAKAARAGAEKEEPPRAWRRNGLSRKRPPR